MTDEELIARLRMIHEWKVGNAAADRIEALVKESAEMEAEAHAHIELWGKALREKAATEANVKALVEAASLLCASACSEDFTTYYDALQATDAALEALKGADHDG